MLKDEWTANLITRSEKEAFERQGFFLIRGVLSPTKINSLEQVVDKIYSENSKPRHRLFADDILQYNPKFLSLIDHPKILPKIAMALGSNISLYYTHLIVTPPVINNAQYTFSPVTAPGWHQDGQFINNDIHGSHRPRLSLKVAYYLTDCHGPGMGNMLALPGDMDEKYPTSERLKKAVPILANKGDAVVFDRRLWHTSESNYSGHTRKVLFFGYAHRWIAPADNMTVSQYYEKSDAIRKQLLRYQKKGSDYHCPSQPGDCPLRDLMEKYQ